MDYFINNGTLYLMHHGIKGQKWGERNYQYEDGSLTPAGKIRYGENNSTNSTKKNGLSISLPTTSSKSSSSSAQVSPIKGVSGSGDSSIEDDAKILKDVTDELFGEDAEEYDGMIKNYNDFIGVLAENTKYVPEDVYGNNPDPGSGQKIISKETAQKLYKAYLKKKNSGSDSDSLSHHGILGQKWGIRRYQNADGTRTALGKKREASEMTNEELRAAINRGNLENRYNQLASQRGGYKVANDTISSGTKILKTASNVSSTLAKANQLKGFDKVEAIDNDDSLSKKQKKEAKKSISEYRKQTEFNIASSVANQSSSITSTASKYIKSNKDLSNISDKELRDIVDRMSLENQYNSLNTSSKKSGKEYLDTVLDAVGTVAGVTGTALSIALAIKELKKGNTIQGVAGIAAGVGSTALTAKSVADQIVKE